MTKALLSERTFSNEGIWVDQCCINQANNDEKLCVVGFMDQIYRRARLVVVVLEDIAIDEAEEAFLEDLMEKYNQGTVNDLYVHSGSAWAAAALLLRISSARWFSRAWCNHELLVSKDQVFFIRVEPRGFALFRILRVSGAFLVGLINVTAAYMTTPDVKDERHVILEAQYHNLQQTGFMSKLLDHFESNASLYHDEEENQLLGSNETKSFMDVFLYCSALGASVEVDKLIITLNIVGCELYFQGTGMTQPECVLFLSILALASGDPTVLCNSGEKLMLVDQKDKQSWLQWPETQDFRGYSKPSIFRRLDYVPDFSQEQVRLDLLVFGNDTTVHQASEPFIAQAARFVDGYIEMSKEQSFAIDESQGQRFFQRRDTNIKVWACALECGLAWFDRGVASGKGFHPRLREALQTFFSDDAARYSFRELCGQNRDQCEIMADSIEAMASILLDSRDPFSIPAWIHIGASRTDSTLIMCPEHRRFTIACPVLLLHDEYTYCKRIFLLDAVQGRRESWKIVGKTAAVGAELMALMEQGMLRRNQLLLG